MNKNQGAARGGAKRLELIGKSVFPWWGTEAFWEAAAGLGLFTAVFLFAVLLNVLYFNKTAVFGQHADVLINTVMARQHLSLFYWGQNRLVNLLPLLVSGVSNIKVNVFLITVIPGLCQTLFFWFAARLALPGKDNRWPAFFLYVLTSFVFYRILGDSVFGLIFSHVEYAAALLLLVVALALVEGRKKGSLLLRTAAASPLVFLALGLCPLALLLLFAWVAWHLLVHFPVRKKDVLELGAALALFLVLFVVWMLLSRYAAAGSTDYMQFSYAQLKENFWRPMELVLQNVQGVPLTVAAVVLLAALFFSVAWGGLRPEGERLFLLSVAASLLFFILWYAAVTAMRWTAMNLYAARYYFIPMVLGMIPTMILGAQLLSRRPKLCLIGTLVVIIALGALDQRYFKRPKPLKGNVFDRIEALAPFENTRRLYVGNYWTSWPLVVRDMARGITSYGICPRGEENRAAVLRFVDERFAAGKSVPVVCTEDTLGNCLRRTRGFLGNRDVNLRVTQKRNQASFIEVSPVEKGTGERVFVVTDLFPAAGNAVESEDRILQVAGKSGLVTFGPYVPLPAGKYEFRVDWTGSPGASPTYDIYVQRKDRVIVSGALGHGAHPFVLPPEYDGLPVEIRTFCGKDCGLSVTGIAVRKAP